MDGGAWWAAVHGVARSQTRLSDSLSLFTFKHWRRKWQPTPVFLPGESQGRGSLLGCRLWVFSCSVMSNFLQAHELQHARLPCPSLSPRSLLKLKSIESIMPFNHLILCHPLLLPSVFPSIGVFSNELTLCIRWPKYWSFSISLSNEYI